MPMVERSQIDELIGRLYSSVGDAVFEDTVALALPPEPRETWIDLQGVAVALASGADSDARRDLALALLHAVLDQATFGPSNRLAPEAFTLLLDAAPDALAASLDLSAGHLYGGKRYLRQHVWSIAGPDGARWLGVLARADDIAANFLMQEMSVGTVPMWPAEDWSDRLDAVAELPTEPRPGVVTIMFVVRPPRDAAPALVRLAMKHGRDERDPLVRMTADRLREHRDSADDSVDLFDWDARHRRPELFRWLLELSGDAGDRGALVAAAVRAGRLPEGDAAWLSARLDRPAWADGEVPWEVDDTVSAGVLRLPAGRLTGGDPWWTGGAEGFPWTIEVPPGSFPVLVVLASHPLYGRQCAALELVLDGDTPVEQWSLVQPTLGSLEGYTVEVGVASFGAPAVYEAGVEFDEDKMDFVGPAWATVEGGEEGTIVLCTVGPQHQLCRTWLGTASDRPVAVVTDLGLLEIDLVENPARPWS